MNLPAATPPMTPTLLPEQATQNLFEHLAANGQGLPAGSSPTQIGDNLMQHLDGFIERSRRYAESARPTPAPPPGPGSGGSAPAPARVAEGQLAQLAGALTRTFDYAIETQMVVRGATQISGSANTLLRGQ